MIALTFALPAESSGIVALIRARKITRLPTGEIISGKIGQHEIAIFHTGVGRVACERLLPHFLRTIRPKLLISSGFAGAVSGNLQVGDVIIAANLSDPDLVAIVQRQNNSMGNAGSDELAAPLSRPGRRFVRLFTVDSVVHSSAERLRVAREQSADAVDMETEKIAEICRAEAVRMLSVRVISDTAESPLPLPPDVLFDVNRQKTNLRKMARYLVRHPFAIARLTRFAGQVRRARRVLTRALPDILDLVAPA